jgi:hypothetical protein
MTKFFIKWWVDTAKAPDTPQELVKLMSRFLEMIKADLSAGKYTDWGQFSNGREGYAISELSESEIFAILLTRMPVIEFEVFPILSVDQSMEAGKKAAVAMQGK